MNRERILKSLTLLSFLFSIVITGCNLINPAEPIPARIHLEPFDLKVGSGQGSNRNKITDVWVYADQNFLGIFNPPVDIPYIGDKDQTQFTFLPGIRNNGIANDPIKYPMYTSYDITSPTAAGVLSNVSPVTHYKPGVVVSLNADFETSNEFIYNRDTIAGSSVVRTTDNPFEGNYSGEIVLSKDAYFIEVGNALALGNLPIDGTPTYLEFQYKSEMDLAVGILGIALDGQSFSNFFYLVKPSENWNMLYIELTDVLQTSGFPAYKILFRAAYPVDSVKPELKIELDNIKVVHL